MRPRLALLLVLLLLLSAACSGANKNARLPEEPHASIYVVNHGWHTGLIVRRADIPAGLWPESGDFPGADYLELGWGDWDYYQANDPGLWLTLKAAFWPTASVLHVVGIRGNLFDRFGGFEIIRLDPGSLGFAELAAFIDQSFARGGKARALAIGPGLVVGHSYFYVAHGRFHLFNTCNGWTARALEAAGYPMGIFRPLTADQVMAKARPFAAAAGR